MSTLSVRTTLFLCLMSLLLLFTKTCYSISLILKIEAYDEECFLVKPPQDGRSRILVGSYELISDNDDEDSLTAEPLLAYLQDGQDNIVYESQSQARNMFEIPLKDKKYWFCIQNSKYGPNHEGEEPEHEDGLTRQVGFHYRVYPAPSSRSRPGEDFVVSRSTEWMDRSRKLEQSLDDLLNHHEYLKVREANHRIVTEKTFNDVLVWTVLEAMVVVGVAAGQVFYFRRYLEKKQAGFI